MRVEVRSPRRAPLGNVARAETGVPTVCNTPLEVKVGVIRGLVSENEDEQRPFDSLVLSALPFRTDLLTGTEFAINNHNRQLRAETFSMEASVLDELIQRLLNLSRETKPKVYRHTSLSLTNDSR